MDNLRIVEKLVDNTWNIVRLSEIKKNDIYRLWEDEKKTIPVEWDEDDTFRADDDAVFKYDVWGVNSHALHHESEK
jgi:hypothetical protein